MDCSGLTSVTIPNSVTTIKMFAFYGCSSLVSITIPNSVTTIGDYAFHGCSTFSSITFPNSVTSIGAHAFENCSSLTSIYSLSPTPPSLNDTGYTPSFDIFSYQYATLYIPEEVQEAYKAAHGWSFFKNIQGIETTGMRGINADGQPQQSIYYDLNGRKLNAPVKGVNIVNGKKVMY
ncbi:MAG: leucine-rich repeat domain-containing protein [Prevotellaceae bacterium]|nr:leucine-rich repeat domain-containing protein [Prevotellaceae bacterium]